jgi:hypothetical protein
MEEKIEQRRNWRAPKETGKETSSSYQASASIQNAKGKEHNLARTKLIFKKFAQFTFSVSGKQPRFLLYLKFCCKTMLPHQDGQ